MKIYSLLVLAGFTLLSGSDIEHYYSYDDPRPNPIDGKTIQFTIVNKTNMCIKASFFMGNQKRYKGVKIEAGRPYTFEIEGRYNKKDSYFRFRKPEAAAKGTGVNFYYKRAAKARGVKIDMVYLMIDNDGNFIVSASEEINPATTIIKADINQKLPPEEPKKKHKKTGEKKKNARKIEKNRKKQDKQEYKPRGEETALVGAIEETFDI